MQLVNFLWIGLLTVPQAFALDVCTGKNFGYKAADPAEPNAYYLCLGLLGKIRNNCHEGYRFNLQAQICVKDNLPTALAEQDASGVKNEFNINQNITLDRPIIFNFFGSFWNKPPKPPIPWPTHAPKPPITSTPASIASTSDDLQSTLTPGELTTATEPLLGSTESISSSPGASFSTAAFTESLESSTESFSLSYDESSSTSEVTESTESSTESSSSSSEASSSTSEVTESTESSTESSSSSSEASSSTSEVTESTESSTESSSSSSEASSSTSEVTESTESSTESSSSSSEASSSTSEVTESTESSTESSSSSSEASSSTSEVTESTESSTESSSSSSEASSSTSEVTESTESSTESSSSSSEASSSTSEVTESTESSTESSSSSSEASSSTSEVTESTESSTEDRSTEEIIYEEPTTSLSSIESTSEINILSSKKPKSTEDPKEDSWIDSYSSLSTTEDRDDISSSVKRRPEIDYLSEIEEISECNSLPSGSYLRDPRSCNRFYICSNGRAISRSCPPSLYFDIQKRVCNFPSLVKCVIDNKGISKSHKSSSLHKDHLISIPDIEKPILKAPISSYEPAKGISKDTSKLNTKTDISNDSSFSEVEDSSDCKGLPNGSFLRDSKSCGKFYVCANGRAIPRNCPGSLFFDIKKRVCNFPSLVDCSTDNKYSYTVKNPASSQNVNNAIVDKTEEASKFIPDCSSVANGVYIRDPRSCNKFFVCANGRAIPRQCPKGLYIDIKTKFCNFPSRVQCSIDSTENLPILSAPVAGHLDCSDKADGSTIRDSKMCNKYYVCLKGTPVTHFCSPGKWFDLNREACELKRMVDCNN
ncbi:probable GPI-anchored adhesin-like protein PGA55 [Drosophila innubila]|uniref:probable GPI-anchored adhesin-like protein PGA55 n=1 Tax=Drosophila innubila TaxID=198719 RepID=UPI00148E8D15|nr:probable GPI-anchored adhesin-like protein PGA55 [Drosophila innubila]